MIKRSDATQPNMALTTWKAGRVRKADVIVAKNYLAADEIEQLNRIVTLFLDFAELRTSQRKDLRMADWRTYVDSFIGFNERPLLKGAGKVSHDSMVKVAHERYESFDSARKRLESLEADAQDIEELAQIEQAARKAGPAR